LNWQADQGKRASLDDFAYLLGYSRPTISMWLNGTRIPGSEAIEHLSSIIGLEIYDALGLPRPNPYLQKINQVFERLSPEHQQKLAEDAEHYEVKNVQSGKTSKQRKTSTGQ
jgi:transcriptional regulator with XRE-family HTH domain